MSLHPKPDPDPYSKTGVLRLNGLAWGALVLCFVLGGSADFWGAVGLGLLAVLLGVLGNAGLCLWKLAKGNRYQAGLYFLALIPLATMLLLLWNTAGHFSKIGG